MKPLREPERKTELAIQAIIDEKKLAWNLTVFSPKGRTVAKVKDPDLHRPGLAFAGYVEKFSNERIQIIGEIEWWYLSSLSSSQRKKAISLFFSFPLPAIFFSKSLVPHPELLAAARKAHVPVIGTSMTTMDLMNVLHLYLKSHFSLRTSLHASLVDVYGVGMLYTGRPGIGKSECCLDLVERGHQLVSDDIVQVIRLEKALVGTGSEVLGHHMEIRGLGIIDVQSLFGIRAIRKEKKIDIVIELIDWAPDINYERIGIDELTTELLGVALPKVIIPVSPGKNITAISEVVAMNALLKLSGINSARLFNEKLIATMKKMNGDRRPDSPFVE